MAFDTKTDFTAYKVNGISILFDGDSAAENVGCTGKLEREMETKNIKKTCGNVVLGSKTMLTGEGTLTLTVFLKHEIALKVKSMVTTGLKTGVYAQSLDAFPTFCLTAEVEDFGGVKQLQAYPNATLNSYPKLTVDNSQDSVDALELSIATAADKNNAAFYEAIEDDLDADTKAKWMTNFNADLVKAAA